MRIWITDGSGAPFTDVPELTSYHRGSFRDDTPYKGALDDVPVGGAALHMHSPADCFVPEAEWCICFLEETAPFIDGTRALTESTPIVLQGMIEGKWLNRFDENLTWKPASLNNNLLAEGPGIPGTLGDLEAGKMEGKIHVEYASRAGRHTQTASVSDLLGHNMFDLVRSVFDHCREHDLTVQAVNCSARGAASALVEDHKFLQRLMAEANVVPEDLRGPAGWKRVASVFAAVAIDEGLIVEPGTPVDLVVTAGVKEVGRGQLTVIPEGQA
jgi:hypothetical protein